MSFDIYIRVRNGIFDDQNHLPIIIREIAVNVIRCLSNKFYSSFDRQVD